MFEYYSLNNGAYEKVDDGVWYEFMESGSVKIKKSLNLDSITFDLPLLRYGDVVKVHTMEDIIDFYNVIILTYGHSMLDVIPKMLKASRNHLNKSDSYMKPFKDIISIETNYIMSNKFFNWDSMPEANLKDNVSGYLFREPTTGLYTYISDESTKTFQNFLANET